MEEDFVFIGWSHIFPPTTTVPIIVFKNVLLTRPSPVYTGDEKTFTHRMVVDPDPPKILFDHFSDSNDASVRLILSQLIKLTNFRNVELETFIRRCNPYRRTIELVDNNNSLLLRIAKSNPGDGSKDHIRDNKEKIMRIEEMYPGLFRPIFTKDIDEIKQGDAKALAETSMRGGKKCLLSIKCKKNRKSTTKRRK